MAIEKGGRSIRGIRYDGDSIGRVIILKAYYDDPTLGRVIVWDGRISETVPAPAIPFAVSMPAPEVHADATVAGGEITYWISPPTVSVSAGSSPAAPPIEYIATLEAPSGLSGSHKIAAPAIEYTVDLEDGAVASSIGGEFVDPMDYTVSLPAPTVHADATVSAPPMVFYIEPVAATGAGAFADVDGGTIEYVAEAVAPSSVTASSSPAGTAPSITVGMPAPAASAGATAYAPALEYTVDTPVPEASALPDFTRQRMVKSGQTQLSNAWAVLPTWGSDATYPAVVSGDSMQVKGYGTVTAVLSWNFYDWGGRPSQVRIKRNGAAIFTSATRSGSATYVESFSLQVVDGDLLTVEAQYTTSFGTVYIRGIGDTFLELIP